MLRTILFDVGGVIILPLSATALAVSRDKIAGELGDKDRQAILQHF